MDLRQAPTSGSGPAQRMPDTHDGSTLSLKPASWKKPVAKPMSRHAICAALCTHRSLPAQIRNPDSMLHHSQVALIVNQRGRHGQSPEVNGMSAFNFIMAGVAYWDDANVSGCNGATHATDS